MSWNGVSSGCFERMSAQIERHVRRREAVARDRERAAAEPGDLDVHAAAEELDRRVRVVEEARADRPPRGFRRRSRTRSATGSSRPACCAPRRRERCALKYALSASSWRMLGERLLRRREAHVDDVEALLDRRSAGRRAGPCPLPVKLAPRTRTLEMRRFGREPSDDARRMPSRDRRRRPRCPRRRRSRRSSPTEIDDGALELADERMARRRPRSRGCRRARPRPSNRRSPTRASPARASASGSAMRSTASFGRLQAGSAAFPASQLCVSTSCTGRDSTGPDPPSPFPVSCSSDGRGSRRGLGGRARSPRP